jgi:hypothetical protein
VSVKTILTPVPLGVLLATVSVVVSLRRRAPLPEESIQVYREVPKCESNGSFSRLRLEASLKGVVGPTRDMVSVLYRAAQASVLIDRFERAWVSDCSSSTYLVVL